jgi:N-acetylmuramate 1-kinase
MVTIPEALISWVEKWVSTRKGTAKTHRIVPLAGDGSPRPFFRLITQSENFVVLYEPAWILSRDYAAHQEYLKSRGVSVPAFLTVDAKSGILVMEDLGDELLQKRILSRPDEKMPWLQRAVTLLAEFHGKTYPAPASLPGAQRAFDETKYSEELFFTLEHLSTKLLGHAPPSEAQKNVVREYCGVITKIGTEVFCHRDYHTRNILVKDAGLYLIDFQDARMGSPHYDLASVLFDAYIPLTDAERDELRAAYQATMKKYPLYDKIRWDTFAADLDAVAYQRVVKAAGSFASFYTRYQKQTHLPYLKPALETAGILAKRCSRIPKNLQSVFPLENWLEQVRSLKLK